MHLTMRLGSYEALTRGLPRAYVPNTVIIQAAKPPEMSWRRESSLCSCMLGFMLSLLSSIVE